ncbi:PP2C family protein-serine/threonine phosphatase [Planobispora rosea]|uniref:PP2C family protein-serine/threonine phosphatase n=1 Tax=Planobispora rosea TaxID=35762 RepID=UPI00083B4614|nr:PP2C family protein-serine/threonine phosphatase [Planobispora rosea]
MMKSAVLVVKRPGTVPRELLRALQALDMTVETWTSGQILDPAAGRAPRGDILLASSALSPQTIKAVGGRFEGVPHVVAVFADDDFDTLEPHVRGGLDYIVPPFLPVLVGARMGTCLERARAEARADLLGYERELQIGREIQRGFLPETLPTRPGWDLDVRFDPARKVAGDFYDVFELVNRRRLALVVADVCDKGVGAALFMALIRSLLRHTAEHSGLQSLIVDQAAMAGDGRVIPVVGATPLMNAVTGTNGYLTRNHMRQGYFATMFFCVLDPVTGSLIYINGGHNPPVVISGSGEPFRFLEPTGPAVGVVPDCDFSLGSVAIDVGDTLFVYTDGVTEARNGAGEFFGEERLLALLREPAASATRLLDRVETSVRGYVGKAEQSDDITMMAVHRREEE